MNTHTQRDRYSEKGEKRVFNAYRQNVEWKNMIFQGSLVGIADSEWIDSFYNKIKRDKKYIDETNFDVHKATKQLYKILIVDNDVSAIHTYIVYRFVKCNDINDHASIRKICHWEELPPRIVFPSKFVRYWIVAQWWTFNRDTYTTRTGMSVWHIHSRAQQTTCTACIAYHTYPLGCACVFVCVYTSLAAVHIWNISTRQLYGK